MLRWAWIEAGAIIKRWASGNGTVHLLELRQRDFKPCGCFWDTVRGLSLAEVAVEVRTQVEEFRAQTAILGICQPVKGSTV